MEEQKLDKLTKNLKLVIILLIIGFLIIISYLLYQNHKLRLAADKALEQSPQKIAEQSRQLVDQVGKLLVLPHDEQPTIATVTDLEKLKQQQFFQRAQLGDKVLIYSQAKKVILYRPSTNQLIEVAPLTGNESDLAK